jgi:hypothetical protein
MFAPPRPTATAPAPAPIPKAKPHQPNCAAPATIATGGAPSRPKASKVSAGKRGKPPMAEQYQSSFAPPPPPEPPAPTEEQLEPPVVDVVPNMFDQMSQRYKIFFLHFQFIDAYVIVVDDEMQYL